MGLHKLTKNMDALLDLDDETLFVVLAIYRADLAEERAQIENDQDENANSLLAVEFFLNDLQGQRMIARDARLVQSMTDAQLTDVSVAAGIAEQERQAREDYALARRLAYGDDGVGPPVADANDNSISRADEDAIITAATPTLSKLAGLWVSERAGRALHPDNTEGDPDPEPEFDGVLQAECCFCLDRKSYFKVVTMPCDHNWCDKCIQGLFVQACSDETLFPPRCCGAHMPLEDVRIFLTREIIDELEEKRIEFTTTNRVYCANTQCLKFVPPANITANVAHCQECSLRTCAFCKSEAHENECQEDVNTQALLDLAQEKGWIRCGNCQAVVELKYGCFHISCRCGHQFCYRCGVAPWKNCQCPQWDDGMLFDRSLQVAAREGRNVAEVREELISRHNCTHVGHWRLISGAARCEECSDRLPSFIFRCLRCRLEVCRRCMRNRIH